MDILYLFIYFHRVENSMKANFRILFLLYKYNYITENRLFKEKNHQFNYSFVVKILVM